LNADYGVPRIDSLRLSDILLGVVKTACRAGLRARIIRGLQEVHLRPTSIGYQDRTTYVRHANQSFLLHHLKSDVHAVAEVPSFFSDAGAGSTVVAGMIGADPMPYCSWSAPNAAAKSLGGAGGLCFGRRFDVEDEDDGISTVY
jgi:hypothetical protein